MGGPHTWRADRLRRTFISVGGVTGGVRPTPGWPQVLPEHLVQRPDAPNVLKSRVLRQLNTLKFNSSVLPQRVVDDPRVKAALPYVGHAAYVILSGGFIMTDIVWLRMLLTGGYGALVCYHALQPRPLRIPLMGSLFFVGANAYMGAKAIREKLFLLTKEENAIYEAHFASVMSTSDFKFLMEHAEMTVVEAGDSAHTLAENGKVADLILILEGSAEVHVDKDAKVLVDKSGLIGEVSFLNGGGAAATATALPGCRYIRWDRERLMGELGKRPSTKNGLELKIGRELTRKLANKSWTEENLLKEIGCGKQQQFALNEVTAENLAAATH